MAGFTLVEMMVTVSVAVVLMTAAVPSFVTVVQNNLLTVQANDFAATLIHARSEARKRRARVALCKSDDGASCSTADSVSWADGWIQFVDDDRDAAVDTGELILEVSTGIDNRLAPDSAFSEYISFLPDGRAIGNGDTVPPAQGGFLVCDARGLEHARDIEISPVGRVRVEDPDDDDSCP